METVSWSSSVPVSIWSVFVKTDRLLTENRDVLIDIRDARGPADGEG